MSDPTPEPEDEMRKDALDRLAITGTVPEEIVSITGIPDPTITARDERWLERLATASLWAEGISIQLANEYMGRIDTSGQQEANDEPNA